MKKMTSSLLSSPAKIVLTGGTSGIGAELVTILHGRGHDLVVLSRRATSLPPKAGIERIDIDLSDTASVRALAADLAGRHSDTSLLINNAALQYPVPLTHPDFDDDAMIAEATINLLAPALLTRAFLPVLRRHGQGAAVVNISSGLAFFPKQATALYCATKAGLHSFSQSLRYQLEADGVAVIEAILPLVDTPMTAGRGSGKISPRDAAEAIIGGVDRREDEIFIGKARLIPLFARLAPALGRRIMRGA